VIQAQCSRYRTTLLVIGFCSVGVHPAAGQRFGRNQVQYRSFGFRVLQTERFDVYFYPEVEDAARDGARMAERWYTRLSQILDHDFTERQPLIPYGSHPAFQPPVPPGRGTRAPRSARAAERSARLSAPRPGEGGTGPLPDPRRLHQHRSGRTFERAGFPCARGRPCEPSGQAAGLALAALRTAGLPTRCDETASTG
jgi:hypothetical protein